jgi:Protein of unknown function (DUF3501)
MKTQIARDQILDLGDYERSRDAIRASAIAARGVRRVLVGPNATLSFENRETVRYQILEMLRAERIAKDADVQHEIETYGDLLPSSDELSATLMFEFPDESVRSVHLRDLVGFEDHLRIEFDGAGVSKAYFDRRQIDSDQISAVQFVRFPISDAQRKTLRRGARVVADHPRYAYTVELPQPTLAALAGDIESADV